MMFSILVPVYNSEKYLGDCVESVLQQSEQDFELVLVDDGSTDGGGALCDRYQVQFPEKIRVIHQPNRGLILARRAGIAAAKGDYCMFLDADDAYEPECLATVRETIEQTQTDIVIFNNYSFFEEDQSIEPNKAVFPDRTEFSGETKRLLYEKMIASECLNNIWMKAIKTPLLQADDTQYALFAGNPHGEDLLQSLYPITHAERIVYRTSELYRYRRHKLGMTRRIGVDSVGYLFNAPVMQQLYAYMALWGMDTPQYQGLFQARKINALLVLFWQNYRGVKTAAQKRAVLNYDWAKHLDAGSGDDSQNEYLPRLRRMQLNAVLKKRKMVIDLFVMFGSMKMRAAHGA